MNDNDKDIEVGVINKDKKKKKKPTTKTTCWSSFVKKLLGVSWILPPLITLFIGGFISFRVAAIVACVTSWLSLGVGYWFRRRTNGGGGGGITVNDDGNTVERQDVEQQEDRGDIEDQDDEDDDEFAEYKSVVWPKTFDVINPVAYGILLPVALILGEEFCRLWMGIIVMGIFAIVCVVSLCTQRPLMHDFIGMGTDERTHPMMKDMIRTLTYVLSVIFLIMFVSNLIIALMKLEVGTLYVVLNFVIPYGSLAIGIQLMYPLGKYIWTQSAIDHYGEDYETILFPNNDKTKNSGQGNKDEPCNKETDEEEFEVEEGTHNTDTTAHVVGK